MAKQRSRYAKARIIFGVLFVLSTLFFLGAGVVSSWPAATPEPPPGPESPVEPSIAATTSYLPIAATATSCLTSVTTFLGFVSATILGWRKERREARATELEGKRHEIEIERARFELERMQAEREAIISATHLPPQERTEALLDSLRRERAIHTKNLRRLEETKAQYGPLDVPLYIQNAIDQIQENLRRVEARIANLSI
ncbi:MAG: hypothetical protein ACETWR_15530 [Anaerolineae bacterium]